MLRYILFITLAAMIFTASAEEKKTKIEVPLRFDRYYSYDDVVEALKVLHNAFPKLTKLEEIGKSEEGRSLYALTINNPETGDALSKPGVYVDGNIHGNEIQAGEVCLYYANMLLTRYGENKKITKAVDKNAHYIVPVVNVDGRYHFFKDGNTPHSNRGLRVPKDDDHDGLFDEDPYDDLDGDGSICQMRIKDPHGKYKPDPEDNRIMVRVKPGEKGEYTLLGMEGIDNDGDGRINEDSEGYLDPNRNWGYNWMPNYVQRGAGCFPLSGTGIKAVNDFITAHPNIIVGFAFHNYGGMWLRVPSEKSTEIPSSDISSYDAIGDEAIKITPGYVYMPSYDLYPTYGDSDSHMYFIHGVYSFVGELFMGIQEEYKSKKEKDKELSRIEEQRRHLKFNDNVAQGELFKEWHKFNHPVYGEIEIGGWVKMSSRLPRPFMLPELVHRNASVVLRADDQTPEITVEAFDVKKIGKNLTQVRIRVENKKGLASMTAQAFKDKLYQRDALVVTGGKVIAGGKMADVRLNKVNYKEDKPEIQFFAMPGNSEKVYQFLIEGKGDVKFEYRSRKAKNAETTVSL